MVAIVGGSRMGLSLGSVSALGQRGVFGSATQGRNGERAFVNVATGDLVLQGLDAGLAGVGPDTAALRTYNSYGGWGYNIDDGNGWQAAPRKYVRNQGNNTLRRYDADGAECDYLWDEAKGLFVAVVSNGSARDTIRLNADATYTWTDGATGAEETYEGGGWSRITSSTDTAGNTIRYTYDSHGLLTNVTMSDGESIEYTYGGKGGSDLLQVTTRLATGEVLRQVGYTYDGHGRLETVTVNLDPSGTLPAGSETQSSYVTRYTYDGNSNRLATATQTDGTSLSFTYVRTADNLDRIASVTDGEGQITQFAYDIEKRTTTVTDPLGVSTVYQYGADGELTRVLTGVTAANPEGLSELRYTYNAIGDVTSMTDGLGNAVVMEYDANGNLTKQVDGAGNTIVRTYDARNQLLTETTYATPETNVDPPTQPQTTRYVYDAAGNNQLRFVVSPEGRVTEYRYQVHGLRTSTIQYSAAVFDASAFGDTDVPTEADLAAWVGAQDLTRSERTDMTYDFRGNLQTVTTYGTVDAAGIGVPSTANGTMYVYDHRGQLLQTVTPDGRGITQNVYDGLGRVVSTVARSADGTLSTTTVTQYDDANGKTTVTLANGLTATSVYDRAGRLISVLQSSPAAANLGTTRYAYDADGRLLMTEDPTGQRRWILYDAAGRKVAEVDPGGGLTEYVYDRASQLTEVIGYENPVDTGPLVDAAGRPTTGTNPNPGAASLTLDRIRPAATVRDARTWSLYDDAGRLTWSVDALGYVTQTRYDGSSRITSVTKYANAIDVSRLRDGKGVELVVSGQAAGVDAIRVYPADGDRTVTRIYNRDGLLRAVIDGEGYLTETRYDAAGQVVETIGYAGKVPDFADTETVAERIASARVLDSLDGLLPDPTEDDAHAYAYYNARGQKIAAVDAEGYLTEVVYDVNGKITKTISYADEAKVAATVTSTLQQLRPGGNPEDQVTVSTWDALGRLSTQTNTEGTVTRYTYDVLGRITHTELALNTAEQRTLVTQYDVQGRVTAELSAEGAALLTGGQTQEEIDEVWRLHATRYTYDAAGRRTSSADANGYRTLFLYDQVGRLRFTVNPRGEVTEQTYDALGRLKLTARYDARVPAETLAGLQGGVLSTSGTAAASRAIAAAKAASAEASETVFRYDARGQVVRTETAITATRTGVTTSAYDAFGQLVESREVIDATRTLVSTARYDRRGLQVETTSDAGDATHVNATTNVEYDAFGRATAATDPIGNRIERKYDRLGRVVEVVDATDAKRTTTYDAFGRVLTETNGRLHTTTYAYDTAKRSVIVTTPENVTLSTFRTRLGQTAEIVDGNGTVTAYEYDRNGNLVSTKVALGDGAFAETTSAFDRANRLLETVDANGNLVVYTYDAASRLLTRTLDPEGLALETSYEYDGKGQQVRITDPRGTVTETTYDLDGQVVSQVVDPDGLALTTVYTYDDRGKQLTVELPGGRVTQYVYDDLGRRTQTIVDPEGLALTESYEYDAAGNVTRRTDGADGVTRYLYDGNGRLTFTVDGEGGVTRNVYDANGNVVDRIAYATRIDLAKWVEGTEPAVTEDPAHDIRVRTVYDKMDRATYTIDGTGAVVAQRYDGNGNVIERIAYAKPLDAVPAMTEEAFAEAIAGIADATKDARIRRTYDALNRLEYSVDALGGVTRQWFDANGNLVKQVAYADRITADEAPADVVPTAADRVALRTYDAANRLVHQVDALGGVFEQVYDAAGNVVQRIAWGTPIAAPTTLSVPPSATDVEQALDDANAEDGPKRVTRAIYDAANRMTYGVDAAGAVTENRYDAAGNVAATIAYASVIPAASLAAVTTEAELAALLPQPSDLDRVTLHGFDAANRMIYAVDAEGYVTRTGYDGAGRVVGTTLYVTRAEGLAAGATLAEIVAAVDDIDDETVDQTTSFDLDAVGNLVASVDALGQAESYAYNGVAEKLSFTNKKQQVWTYDYDAGGRLIRETNPEVAVTTVGTDANGNLVPGTTSLVAIVNEMAYDALGNLLSRTEAVGLPEQRTTGYEYDALGRQVKVTFPPVAVYAPESAAQLAANGASGVAARAETVKALFAETVYDSFGNAVASTDVGGHTAYKTYDALGRVRFEIDALGYVTGYERNAFGDVETLTRYAAATTLQASPDAAPRSADVEAALATLDHSADRAIATQYDGAGRAVVVTQPEAWVFNGDGRSYLAASVVKSTFNAFGQAVQLDVLADKGADPASDVWATTTQYYDRRGLQIASVDALGYVTARTYDAAGNVTVHTEYATPASSRTLEGYTVEASDDDRTVVSLYDQNNRKVSDTRKNVEFSVRPDGTSIRGDVKTSFGYDAVGNLTKTTQELGTADEPVSLVTYSYYDALGRTTAVAAPTLDGAVAGSPVTPLTVFARDAYGNVVVKTEYANGALGATDTEVVAGATSAGDRVTVTRYDVQGHAVQMTDANGASRFMSYDEGGRLAKQWQGITSDDGFTGGAFVHTLFTVFQYDALGRQTAVVTPAATSVVRDDAAVDDATLNHELMDDRIEIVLQGVAGTVTTSMAYNAFGEMVERATAPSGAAPGAVESFEYDTAGRLWRTNSGDGNVKVTLFDVMGRQTALITSAGSAGSATDAGLDLATAESARALDELGNEGLRRIDSELDLLGRTVRQTLPERRDPFAPSAAAYRPVIEQTFDRWGNVLTQGDARNAEWITSYRYNANNQVIEQTQPHVDAMGADGVISDVTPVTKIYYDALGRQVAMRDANGNVNGQTYDAAGNLRKELHADGGVVEYRYDAFGNKVRLETAEHHVTTYGYDKLGHNTSITSEVADVYSISDDYTVTSGREAITTSKVYDEAGRVVRDINGKGEITRYTYDSRGNVVVVRQPLGQSNRSVYDANGRQIAGEDGNGYLTTWAYDDFGLLIDHKDFQIGTSEDTTHVQPVVDYVDFSFEYDEARQLLSQHSDRGNVTGDASQSKDLHYKYDAAGQMVEIFDDAIDQTTRYSYNAIGKHVWEWTSQATSGTNLDEIPGSPVYQDQLLAYDALGRLVRVTGLDGVDVRFDYDAFGNRMRQRATYNVQHVEFVEDWAWVDVPDTGPGRTGTRRVYKRVGEHYDSSTDSITKQLWFAYDEMNRQVLVDGAINGNKADLDNLITGQGHLLEYDQDGNRVQDTYLGKQVYEYQPPSQGHWYERTQWGDDRVFGYDPNAPDHDGTTEGETVETGGLNGKTYVWKFDAPPPKQYPARAGVITEYYAYDELDRLEAVTTDAYGVNWVKLGEAERLTLEVRHYDAASRVVEAGPLGALAAGYVDAFTGNASNAVSEKSRLSVYDANGRLSKQRTVKPDGDDGDTAPDVDSEMEYEAGADGWNWQTDELLQAVDAAGKPVFDAEGKPVYVQATDGTGLPKFDEYGNPIYVQQTDANGNPVYDADGNPVYVQQTDAAGNPVFDANGNPVYVQATDGTGEPLFDDQGNPIWKTYKLDHHVDGGYDDAGNVKAYRSTSSGVTSYYHFTQANYDGYREAVVTGYRSDNAGSPGRTTSKYDANGYLVSISDATKPVNDRTFVNDASGHVLLKKQVQPGSREYTTHLLRQLVVDGNVLAVYGAGTDPLKPATDEGDPRFNTSQGNFDLNYQPITSAYPGPSAGQYQVRGGDTLQGIAQASYGDASLWYLIANANGLRGDQDLRIGQTLVIPSRVGGAHNTADTFKPYDPSKVVGDTTPNLPVPQSDGGGGCGALGIILTIVIVIVAVVVTVYTAGAATAALSPLLGTVGGAIVGGAVGGAVGSIVSQGLSMAVGMQEEFSWTQVGLGALGGAVGAGVSQAFQAAGLTATQGIAGWATAGARAAVSSAATQGLAVLTGLQEDFSWASVAASAVGAAVGAAVAEGTGNLLDMAGAKDGFWKDLTAGTVSGFASGVTMAAMRGGKIDFLRIAADAFGNTLGNSIGEALKPDSWSEAALKAAEARAKAAKRAQEAASNEPPETELRETEGEATTAVDEGLGESEAEVEGPRGKYTAEAGDGPLAIAKGIDRDNPYAVMAKLAAEGKITYDPVANRWRTVEGQTYTADLSGLSADEIAVLDRAGRRAVSAEAGVDARRAAIAQAQAALKAQQEAQAAQAQASAQAQAQQANTDAAGAARQPSLAEQAGQAVAQQRASDQAFWNNQVKNADTWWGASLAQVGRAFNNAGYDIADSAVGVAGLVGKSVDALDAAVSDPVGTLTALGDATLSATDALGNAVMHPVDTANQLASDVTAVASALKKEATTYIKTHSVNEMAEDALRLGAGSLAEAGLGKVVGAAGTAATKTLGLTDEVVEVAAAVAKVEEKTDSARDVLLKQVSKKLGGAQTLSEAKGVVHATREMERLGYKLEDVSLKFRGNQGVDLVFSKGDDFAIAEAKHGGSLSALAKDSRGLRQGSNDYNISRLERYLKYGDGTYNATANQLLNKAYNNDLKSFASFYRAGATYELPVQWPKVPAIRR
jgi:YD repeat-containing protein